MGAFASGILTPYTYNGVSITPVYAVAIKFFANRTPMCSMLDVAPLGASSFKITNDRFRPSSTTLNNSGTVGSGDTTITVTDGSMFMPGDVVEIDSEAVLITATSGNALTVVRAQGGTSAASHTDAGVVYLIGNTRTGAETEQAAISYVPTTATQYAQTFQHPWQVGGATATDTAIALPPGVPSFIKREQLQKMQNCQDDVERSYYFGRGSAQASVTGRPAMYGLRSLLTTNNTTAPTNSGAYKPDDLIRDTIQKCYDGGGNPNLLIVSNGFLTGFATWGMAAQRLESGSTIFGTPITTFEVPFLNGIEVVPAPLLKRGGTSEFAFCLSRDEVRQRIKRAMYDKPRGSRGDAEEGDIIAEQAIDVENEQHHAFVSGITAFSAS